MASPEWFRWLLKKTFPGRFHLAKATRLPVLGRIMEHSLFGGDDIVYLPPDQTVANRIPVNRKVERPADLAAPSAVIDHFVNQASHLFIMNTCICRDASHCEDYPQDLGCLFMGEAVKDINPKFGRMASRKEALEHLKKCRKAGLVHLIGRNKLDSIWLHVRPKEKLLTVCHCCPCCCLWKILPDVSTDISSRVNRLPGVEVTVTDECVACGACTQDICFVNAIQLDNNRAEISDACRGCGRCVEACPTGAIEMTVPAQQDLESTISRISRLVDLT